MPLIRTILDDIQRNRGSIRAIVTMTLFRVSHDLRQRSHLAALPVTVAYKFLTSGIWGIDIPIQTQIGQRLRLQHPYLIVIHSDTVIGDDVTIKHGVTLGIRTGEADDGAPVLGNRVFVAPGAQILGRVKVGDDAQIGAGAVVLTDVPSGATAVGVPARILQASSKT